MYKSYLKYVISVVLFAKKKNHDYKTTQCYKLKKDILQTVLHKITSQDQEQTNILLSWYYIYIYIFQSTNYLSATRSRPNFNVSFA